MLTADLTIAGEGVVGAVGTSIDTTLNGKVWAIAR